MCGSGGSRQDWFTAGVEDTPQGRRRARQAASMLLNSELDPRRCTVTADEQTRAWIVREPTGRQVRHDSLDGLLEWLHQRGLVSLSASRIFLMPDHRTCTPTETAAGVLDAAGWASLGISLWRTVLWRRQVSANFPPTRQTVDTPGGRLDVRVDDHGIHVTAVTPSDSHLCTHLPGQTAHPEHA